MELFKDIHLVKLELLSNSTTIDSALNYIRNKQQRERIVISLSCIVLSLLLFFINNCLYIDRKLAATILEVDKLQSLSIISKKEHESSVSTTTILQLINDCNNEYNLHKRIEILYRINSLLPKEDQLKIPSLITNAYINAAVNRRRYLLTISECSCNNTILVQGIF